jgi:hypothetical protein
MAREYTSGQFERAVLDYYLDKGEAATIKELAQYTGRAEGTLRRALEHVSGSKVDYTEVSVTRYSKNYPGIQVGSRMVAAYQPSRAALVEAFNLRGSIIDDLKKEIFRLNMVIDPSIAASIAYVRR